MFRLSAEKATRVSIAGKYPQIKAMVSLEPSRKMLGRAKHHENLVWGRCHLAVSDALLWRTGGYKKLMAIVDPPASGEETAYAYRQQHTSGIKWSLGLLAFGRRACC